MPCVAWHLSDFIGKNIKIWRVPKIWVITIITPKSWIFIGCSIINHWFWGTHLCKLLNYTYPEPSMLIWKIFDMMIIYDDIWWTGGPSNVFGQTQQPPSFFFTGVGSGGGGATTGWPSWCKKFWRDHCFRNEHTQNMVPLNLNQHFNNYSNYS